MKRWLLDVRDAYRMKRWLKMPFMTAYRAARVASAQPPGLLKLARPIIVPVRAKFSAWKCG